MDTVNVNGTEYVRLDPAVLAVEIASQPSDKQALLFNEMGAACKAWKSYNYGEPQWADMAHHLNEDGRGLLRSMVQFLDETEPA